MTQTERRDLTKYEFAQKHGIGHAWARQAAYQGLVPGAYKDESGQWRFPPDAKIEIEYKWPEEKRKQYREYKRRSRARLGVR